MDFAS